MSFPYRTEERERRGGDTEDIRRRGEKEGAQRERERERESDEEIRTDVRREC